MGNTKSSNQRKRYAETQTEESTKTVVKPRAVPPNPLSTVPVMSLFATQEGYVCGYDNGVILHYDWHKGTTLRRYGSAHSRTINQVIPCKSKDRTGGFFSCSRDLKIRQWRFDEEKEVQTFQKHELTVTAIDVDAKNEQLFSGGRDTVVCLWDIATGKCITSNKISQNLVTCVKYIPNESCLVAQGSEDLTLRIWDTRCLRLSKPAAVYEDYVYFPLDIDVSMCGNYLVTSSKGFNGVGCEGKVWDRRKNQVVQQYQGHQQDTTSCRFFSSLHQETGNIPNIVTASRDSTIKIWNGPGGGLLLDHLEVQSQAWTSLCVKETEAPNEFDVYASSFSGKVFIYHLKIMDSSVIYNCVFQNS